MGIKVGPIESCHGVKTDDELMLWADNIIGVLSDGQERECDGIYLENAEGGPRVFDSKEEALGAKTGSPAIKSVARRRVIDTFTRCAKKYEGTPQPKFIRKVGTCVDKAFPGKGRY